MIWKVSWRSKKCPENLENVSGWSKKCLDNLENVSGWYGKCLGDLKNVWIIWKVSWQFKRGCHKFWIYIQLKKSIKCLSANSFPYKCTLWSIFGPFLCLRSCKNTFYGHLSQIRKLTRFTRVIRKVFATKILLSGKFLLFLTLRKRGRGWGLGKS